MAANPNAGTFGLLFGDNGDVGRLDNAFRALPASASSAFVATSGQYATRGQERKWTALLQYLHSRRNGMAKKRACLLAGFRGGLIHMVRAANWYLHGNSFATVKAAFGTFGPLQCPLTQEAYDQLPAAQREVLQWQPVSEERLIQHMGNKYLQHAAERLSPAQLRVAGQIALALRGDEVVNYTDEEVMTNEELEDVRDPEVNQLIRHAAESALSFAQLVVFHMQRVDGHHWLTNQNNPVMPALRSYIASTKITGAGGIVDDDIHYVLHDSFHVFSNLSQLVHTMMAMEGIEDMYTMAVDYRYPFPPKGSAIITSGAAVADMVWETLRGYDMTNSSGFFSAPVQRPLIDVLKAFHDARRLMVDTPDHYTIGRGTGAVGSIKRIQNARGLGHFLLGAASGLGLTGGPLNAPSLGGATAVGLPMYRAGAQLGREILSKAPRQGTDAKALGLEEKVRDMLV